MKTPSAGSWQRIMKRTLTKRGVRIKVRVAGRPQLWLQLDWSSDSPLIPFFPLFSFLLPHPFSILCLLPQIPSFPSILSFLPFPLPHALTFAPIPIPSKLSGGCELTVVLQDFNAGHSSELTIQVGQTVELLERPSERPGWCLVRTTERSPPQEGLVPSSALCISHSRSSVEMDCFFPLVKGRDHRAGGVWPGAPLGVPASLSEADGGANLSHGLMGFPRSCL